MSSQFKKDFKKARKLPLADLKAIFEVVSILEMEVALDDKYRGHELSSSWCSFRECYIRPDLLLIYKRNTYGLQLARPGTHSDLF